MQCATNKRSYALILVVMCVQALLLGWSSRVHSPTWDEPGHLAAGISHWQMGRHDLYSVNPPLVRTIAAAATLLVDAPEMDWKLYSETARHRSEVLLGRRMVEINREKTYNQFFVARIALIPIALLGTLGCFWISAQLFGKHAGIVAASLWAFSPTVLGYGSVITPDLASAVIALAISIALFFWIRSPSWGHALWLGVVLGLAMLTKSIWIFSPFAVAFAWLIWRLGDWKNFDWSKLRGESLQFGALTLCAVFLVNGFYGFAGSCSSLGSYKFISSALTGIEPCEDCPGKEEGNRFSGTVLSSIPVPLPRPYVYGMDVQRNDFEEGLRNPAWKSYLHGEWKQGGWWYFYFVGLFYKETLLLWGLCLVAIAVSLKAQWSTDTKLMLLCMVAPAFLVILIISLNTSLNRYVRYAIPVLPFLIIWTSQAVIPIVAFMKQARFGGMRKYGPTVSVASLSVASFVLALLSGPHWLSYFNVLAGGMKDGYHNLCDSNVDWGQDIPAVANWLTEHPEAAAELKLAYFGSIDPINLGIDYRLPVQVRFEDIGDSEFEAVLQRVEPGWYIVSKNFLVGHQIPMPTGKSNLIFQNASPNGLAYLNCMIPVDEIGGSMLVFHVTNESLAEIATYCRSRFAARIDKDRHDTLKTVSNKSQK